MAGDEVRRVPASGWADAVAAGRDAGLAFDWLTAVDEIGREPVFRVVCRLRTTGGGGVRLETTVPRAAPELASVRAVFAGASWHERATADFFGVRFVGGDDRPLLLRREFGGHPLRKDFVLGARVARPWPGGKDPGESGAAGRRRMVPPGVPDPEVWGERAGDPADAEEVAASVAGGRLRRRR